MNRLVVLLSVVVCLTAAACGSDTTTSPTTGTTQTFSGTLVQGAQNSYPFTTTNSGTAIVTASSLLPVETVGLGIGTLNGSTCVPTIQNASAQQMGTVSMAVTSATTYCALVYDPGDVTQSVAYTITVTAP